MAARPEQTAFRPRKMILTGWTYAKNESKSRTALMGLKSGIRYRLRVTANGTASPGYEGHSLT